MSRYTEEQVDWLRENIHGFDSYASLADGFNLQFSERRSKEQISDKCIKNMEIKIGVNKGRIKKGDNKRALPIGTIRKSRTGTYIKICDIARDISGYQAPNWMPLQQKIYEDAHGKIPDGTMVCFLDCDHENFAVENLYPITRAISIRMAYNGWWSTSPEITLTAILLCELQNALKNESQRSQ